MVEQSLVRSLNPIVDIHIRIIYLEIFRRNLTAGAIFSYDALPESLKTVVLVRTKVEEDPEVLKERQETVKVSSKCCCC